MNSKDFFIRLFILVNKKVSEPAVLGTRCLKLLRGMSADADEFRAKRKLCSDFKQLFRLPLACANQPTNG